MMADVEEWWQAYLERPNFRLREEIPAHQAEYQFLMMRGNRRRRRLSLVELANRLSGPLYGRMVSPARAKQLIRAA